jgi:cbb3-type cytochrome c oxidase subunit III
MTESREVNLLKRISMTNMIPVWLKLMLLGAVTAAVAAGPQDTPPPSGQSLYRRRCVMCHGPEGKGFPALKSPDFTDPKWQASLKDKDLVEVIKNGKKETHMPAFADKLTDDEIKTVVAHIRSLGSKKK